MLISEALGQAPPVAAVLGDIKQRVQQLQVVELYVAPLVRQTGGNTLTLRFGNFHARQSITKLRISVNTP